MSVNVHIEHIYDIWANFKTDLDTKQLGILSDELNELVWYDGTNYQFPAVSKYWNGSWNYQDTEFNDVIAYGDLLPAEYIKHNGDTDNYWRFRTDQQTCVVGGLEFINIVEGGTDYIEFNSANQDIDHIFNTTVPDTLVIRGSDGMSTFGAAVTFAEGSQDYLITDRSTNLAIQGQSAGTGSVLELFNSDGDGTDITAVHLYGVGTPASITDRERLITRWDVTSTSYHIYSEADGTGTLRPLVIFTEGNADQIHLNIDGTTWLSGDVGIGPGAAAPGSLLYVHEDQNASTEILVKNDTDDTASLAILAAEVGIEGMEVFQSGANHSTFAGASGIRATNNNAAAIWFDTGEIKLFCGSITTDVDFIFKDSAVLELQQDGSIINTVAIGASSADGNDLTVQAGESGNNAANAGGDLTIKGGDARASSDADGGDTFIEAGDLDGAGADGNIYIGSFSGGSYILSTNTGDITFVNGAGLNFANMYVRGNAVETVVAVAGTYVQFVSFGVNGQENGSVSDHTEDHITVSVGGRYYIACSIHCETVSGGTADEFGFEVRTNDGNDIYNNLHAHRLMSGGGGDIGSVGISGIIELSANDTIEVWATNEDDTDNIIIEDCSLSAIQIGGELP